MSTSPENHKREDFSVSSESVHFNVLVNSEWEYLYGADGLSDFTDSCWRWAGRHPNPKSDFVPSWSLAGLIIFWQQPHPFGLKAWCPLKDSFTSKLFTDLTSVDLCGHEPACKENYFVDVGSQCTRDQCRKPFFTKVGHHICDESWSPSPPLSYNGVPEFSNPRWLLDQSRSDQAVSNECLSNSSESLSNMTFDYPGSSPPVTPKTPNDHRQMPKNKRRYKYAWIPLRKPGIQNRRSLITSSWVNSFFSRSDRMPVYRKSDKLEEEDWRRSLMAPTKEPSDLILSAPGSFLKTCYHAPLMFCECMFSMNSKLFRQTSIIVNDVVQNNSNDSSPCSPGFLHIFCVYANSHDCQAQSAWPLRGVWWLTYANNKHTKSLVLFIVWSLPIRWLIKG